MSEDAAALPLALDGLRVLDLTGDSGQYAGKLLADLGADVVRVEPPGGSPARRTPPLLRQRSDPDASLSFLYFNLNKRGITLNLESADGRALFRQLAAAADVIVETFAPGYLPALGLGYDDLRALNGGLVLASITPYGQTGPHRDLPGSDLTAMAMGGLMAVTGEPGRPPLRLAADQSHLLAGSYAAYGIALALLWRGATGTGQHVDISLQEAVAASASESGIAQFLARGYRTERAGSSRSGIFPYGIFRARDGYVSIGAITPAFWDGLAAWVAEATGDPTITDEVFRGPSSGRWEFRELLTTLIETVTEQATMEELYVEGQRRHLPIAPVNTPAGIVADRQLEARGFFTEIEHPAAGALHYPGAPYHWSGTPVRVRRPAPRVGEHNHDIYVGELGLTAERMAALHAAGAL